MRIVSLAATAVFALGAVFASSAKADPKPLTMEAWAQLQASAPGKATIVHFWGLTCSICTAELADWGTFVRQSPDVRVVFVNWDPPAMADTAKIDAKLEKSGLGSVESWVKAESFENKLRFAIDRDWLGEMPRTRLISADGTVVSFSGAADFAKLKEWLTTRHYSGS